MNRGHNREVVFQTDDDHAGFLDLLDRYRQRFPIRVLHYRLMSNRFYLLLQCAAAKQPTPFVAGLLRA